MFNIFIFSSNFKPTQLPALPPPALPSLLQALLPPSACFPPSEGLAASCRAPGLAWPGEVPAPSSLEVTHSSTFPLESLSSRCSSGHGEAMTLLPTLD